MLKVVLLLLLLCPVLATSFAVAGDETHGPDAVEWGAVAWHRDFTAAEAEARATGKPILLLFQEVPG